MQGVLPKYSGPYDVGVMEIEVPVESPRSFSHIRRKGEQILTLETVLMAIFYPAAPGAGTGKDPSGRKWSRATWLARPRLQMAQGYGKFAGVGNVAVPHFAATTMLTKLPAFRNPPPADHWPPKGDVQSDGPRIRDGRAKPPIGEPLEPHFPLMIFSHGLGGTRTAYSTICGEFASYGFVVCAIEHRDGSGPRTFVNLSPDGEDLEEKPDLTNPVIQERKFNLYKRVDYIWPKGNPYDTSPQNKQGVDKELRAAQIEMRLAEIEAAYHVLRRINEGQGALVAEKNLRRKGNIGSSSRGLEGVDWDKWKNRFDCDDVTMMGHSFGGATSVEALRQRKRFPYFSQGIILDIWGMAVQPHEGSDEVIRVPVIAINSEAFMYWPENQKAITEVVEEAKGQGCPSWLLTVRGTIHIAHSDFPLLYPLLIAALLKMTANPRRAIDLNVTAGLEFMNRIMPRRHALLIGRAFTDEQLLEQEVLEELPDEHKPDKKNMAWRLDAGDELRDRALAKVIRKTKRAKRELEGGEASEVWIHIGSEEDEVRRFRERKGGEWELMNGGKGDL